VLELYIIRLIDRHPSLTVLQRPRSASDPTSATTKSQRTHANIPHATAPVFAHNTSIHDTAGPYCQAARAEQQRAERTEQQQQQHLQQEQQQQEQQQQE
jgi:hypothetical protein